MAVRFCQPCSGIAALAALVAVVLAAGRCNPFDSRATAAEEQSTKATRKKLPPLIVDTKTPLLLDGGKKPAKEKSVSASVAENTACYVCHENYHDEPLVAWHADGDVGCVDCHGKSYAHRNDENNTTPPDVMFPRHKIDVECENCHETHDVRATQMIKRLRERVPRVSDSRKVVCTDCHGRHRLDMRTVVWDRNTRKLLTGDADAQKTTGPSLSVLKALAGSWVRSEAGGRPTQVVVSEYRVTAAGSAVVEVLFPGSDREMMTVYYQDGGELLLTHYCAAKNQPRMRCRKSADPRNLVFEFVDATNMRSMSDLHMHAASLTVVDDDRIKAVWQAYDKGKPADVVKLDLVRQRK